MSCNGCRVLRRGCSENCILRPCLEGIESPKAQSNSILFLSKFFGRSDLLALIAAVPPNKRPALFQSLLYEACGRTVNPVNGAVGLLSTGNWQVCQAAVETVLAGGVLRPNPACVPTAEASETFHKSKPFMHGSDRMIIESQPSDAIKMSTPNKRPCGTASFWSSDVSDVATNFEGSSSGVKRVGGVEPKLLNLFV